MLKQQLKEMLKTNSIKDIRNTLEVIILEENVFNSKSIKISDIVAENWSSLRINTVAKNLGIVYINEFVNFSEPEILKQRKIGRKTLNEIKELLSKYGLRLKESFI